jgi:hypothetical protein
MNQRSEIIENSWYQWAWCYGSHDLKGFPGCATEDTSISIEQFTGEITGRLQRQAGDRAVLRRPSRRTIHCTSIRNHQCDDSRGVRDGLEVSRMLTLIARYDGQGSRANNAKLRR